MHDVIIVGAGAAAVAAAWELAGRGVRPLILDVGHAGAGSAAEITGDIYSHRSKHDTFDLVIGDRLQGLGNIMSDVQVPVKLTSPVMEYVTRDADRLGPIRTEDFHPVQSFATGGLANAWGAGLYRFSDRELEEFPLRESDLAPYFTRLTREIGINGSSDDLDPYFGPTEDLMPPVRLSHNIGKLHDGYQRRKKHFDGEMFLGYARTGVLTEPKDGRPAAGYDNLEFWQESASLYKPALTLDKMITRDLVDYRRGFLVQSWEEHADHVSLAVVRVDTGETTSFSGRKVILAAGAINTTKIVLASAGDHATTLPLLENPALQVPFVMPGSIGRPLDRNAFGLVQLNLVWESGEFDALLQGSLMDITSPSRSEFFASLPFAAHANLALLRYLLPGMIVMQLFFPSESQKPAGLSLSEDGSLKIRGHANTLDIGKIKRLLGHLRRMGAWSHPALVVRVPTGHAIHYAGTLPMRDEPGPYECDPAGLLAGTRNVFIGDSASFPNLPAKNMSFTMMANAMRIAARLADELDNSKPGSGT